MEILYHHFINIWLKRGSINLVLLWNSKGGGRYKLCYSYWETAIIFFKKRKHFSSTYLNGSSQLLFFLSVCLQEVRFLCLLHSCCKRCLSLQMTQGQRNLQNNSIRTNFSKINPQELNLVLVSSKNNLHVSLSLIYIYYTWIRDNV